MFFRSNGATLQYDEDIVSNQLDQINQLISTGVKPAIAIEKVFQYSKSNEYRLIRTMYSLAGSISDTVYDSPFDIVGEVQSLIRYERAYYFEDRSMVEEKVSRKTRFKMVPIDSKEAMRIVDELIKKNPRTMKLLEQS